MGYTYPNKREAQHKHDLERAPNFSPEVSKRDLQQMQEDDNSLETVSSTVSETLESHVLWDGGQEWRPRGSTKLEKSGATQLVLPRTLQKCTGTCTLLTGHLNHAHI